MALIPGAHLCRKDLSQPAPCWKLGGFGREAEVPEAQAGTCCARLSQCREGCYYPGASPNLVRASERRDSCRMIPGMGAAHLFFIPLQQRASFLKAQVLYYQVNFLSASFAWSKSDILWPVRFMAARLHCLFSLSINTSGCKTVLC